MDTIEDFFVQYFRERTDILRDKIPVWEAHIKKFFTQSYSPWQPDRAVRDSEQERILSVEPREEGYQVITSGQAGGSWRMRYRTLLNNESWQIASIEWECGICHGSGMRKDGTTACRLCKGAGWKLVGASQGASK
jgi:hypothetical protein